MSRLLKLHDAADAPAISSLHSAWNAAKDDDVKAPSPVIDPELLRLRDEREQLRQRLQQQETEIAALRKEVDGAFQNGETQGREAGIRDAADQGAKTLATLESGVEHAIANFNEVLSGLERLAPMLARQGLAGILGAADNRSDLVAAIVLQQLKAIETQAVIHIEVSAADFADEAALSRLGDSLGYQGVTIHAYSALKSGDCRIKLKLGALEVGLDQQWGRLKAMLNDMAEPAGARHD